MVKSFSLEISFNFCALYKCNLPRKGRVTPEADQSNQNKKSKKCRADRCRRRRAVRCAISIQRRGRGAHAHSARGVAGSHALLACETGVHPLWLCRCWLESLAQRSLGYHVNAAGSIAAGRRTAARYRCEVPPRPSQPAQPSCNRDALPANCASTHYKYTHTGRPPLDISVSIAERAIAKRDFHIFSF